MNRQLLIDTEGCYRLAEQKAAQYFSTLYELVSSRRYEDELIKDLEQWRAKHISKRAWFSKFIPFKQKQENCSISTAPARSYLTWLDKQGKLDAYLQRSVSYIYLRDLGKRLDQPATKAKIAATVQDLKAMIKRSNSDKQGQQQNFIGLDSVYRWAQKEGVESAAIWVIGKLKLVEQHLPEEIDGVHALRKLIKIIIGVVLHAKEQMDESTSHQQRIVMQDQAIRLGYCYGLTYPFIDDLLDSHALNKQEKLIFANMLRSALSSGDVPDLQLSEWNEANHKNISFIHKELTEAFQYVKSVQNGEIQQHFFEQAYVFFQSQEVDRMKELSNMSYSNEDLYIPIILKSASSRLIARSVLNPTKDESFEQLTFYYGIYNQLSDDLADLFDDFKAQAVTPYTYYLTYYQKRSDLLNPFQLYWAVIAHLLHHVYNKDESTRDVIIGRAIGALKRFKLKHGTAKFNELMGKLTGQCSAFYELLYSLVEQAENVVYLDKLVRDQLSESLQTERGQKEQFSQQLKQARKQINEALLLDHTEHYPQMRKQLIAAANYSLESGGKRLRPLMAWLMGVEQYQLPAADMVPLLKALEYMHTASLIFDDLPTQDNADFRRGRPTLHTIHGSATAELTGLLLIQRAINEQASLLSFNPSKVLEMLRYSSKKAEELCIGQAMDLQAKGQKLTLNQLNEICYYKTAIAFEAALVMPAILAGAGEEEITALKKYAYHAGIAFQIRDDLLDAAGETSLLGKPVGQDKQNNTSTFVSVLGEEGAQQAMWQHYCDAADALKKLNLRTSFLHHLLHYIVFRNH